MKNQLELAAGFLFLWITVSSCVAQKLLSRPAFHGDIPGFDPRRTRTLFARGLDLPLSKDDKLKGGVVLALPDNMPEPPRKAFMELPIGNGQSITIPKGFYHTSDTEVETDTDFDLPSAGNPLSFFRSLVGGRTRRKQKDGGIGGIYLPMPFGLNPLALQLLQKEKKDLKEQGGIGLKNVNRPVTQRPLISTILSQSLRESIQPPPQNSRYPSISIQLLRLICATRSIQYCRAARNEHLRQRNQYLKANDPSTQVSRRITSTLLKSLVPKIEEGFLSLIPTEKPMVVPIGGSKTETLNSQGSGMFVSLPGLDPVYLGGFFDAINRQLKNIGT